jgi:predicted flavoprotein YhiN
MTTFTPTPLAIVGGGAAGLMAACRAAELGVRPAVLERKHRPGSKLLMCGNGRCNLTSCLSAEAMLADFGEPLTAFLGPALREFSPDDLQDWFTRHRLPLMRTRDGKVFPRSERAPDVVHCFADTLRDAQVPLCLNAPVESVTPRGDGFRVAAGAIEVHASRVLIATGGVSYPKTGSVGDGQRFARDLGHRLQPYRPGLVGIEWESSWLGRHKGESFPDTRVRVFDGDVVLGETSGLLECERWGLGGGAISNATRLLSRAQAREPGVEIAGIPGCEPIRIRPVKLRPLKEAMVTVGGVDLADVSAETMESRLVPGLYFAGEVLDVDGPTGGYNLTAAFATARLAVAAAARALGARPPSAAAARPRAGGRQRSHRTGGKPRRQRRS